MAGLLLAAAPGATATEDGPSSIAPAAQELTVLSVSPVYHPRAGVSVTYVAVRNDDAFVAAVPGRGFTVTFFDRASHPVGVATGDNPAGAPGVLSTSLTEIPPGERGDVAAVLRGAGDADHALVTEAAASGAARLPARLPLTAPEQRDRGDAGDSVSGATRNITGYAASARVVLFAEDAGGAVLGVAATTTPPVAPGAAVPFTATYTRLPGEAVADHYAVRVEAVPDPAAVTTLAAPVADDTPYAGRPVTVATGLLDASGAGLAGVDAALTARVPGRAPVVLARARSGADGSLELRAVLPPGTVLQISTPDVAARSGAATGDFLLPLRVVLSARGPAAAVAPGRVQLTGSLPGFPGDQLLVQAASASGPFRTVSIVRTDPRAQWRALVTAGASATRFRVVAPATDLREAVSSDTLVVRLRPAAGR